MAASRRAAWPQARRVSDRACAIDAAAVLSVGAAICVASHQLAVMSLLVPAVVAGRFLAWARLPAAERGLSLRREAAFFALCTLLGAANDWNTVVRHHVYDYSVPHGLPDPRSVPAWMLLYWGLIVRFVATLAAWQRLSPPSVPGNELRCCGRVVTSPALKVGGELVLVVTTRQLIYTFPTDPLLSWLPFAVALALYLLLVPIGYHGAILLLLALFVGPLVEVGFIQVGHLHRYQLGWLGGVPVWIVLWWTLAVLIWADLSARILAWLREQRAAS